MECVQGIMSAFNDSYVMAMKILFIFLQDMAYCSVSDEMPLKMVRSPDTYLSIS